MKFRLRHALLRIRFEHVPPQEGRVCRFHDRLVQALTHCYIEREDGIRQEPGEEPRVVWSPVAIGDAACSYADTYVKETGRRIALTRAIECWPRDDRTAVWRAYWKAKGYEA